MKLILSLLLIALSSSAHASSPFTISRDKIQAILSSDLLWKKLSSPVETIVYKGYDQTTKASTYAITTTEKIGILNASGVTVGFKDSPCLVIVKVVDQGSDPFITEWHVTEADFTACPLN